MNWTNEGMRERMKPMAEAERERDRKCQKGGWYLSPKATLDENNNKTSTETEKKPLEFYDSADINVWPNRKLQFAICWLWVGKRKREEKNMKNKNTHDGIQMIKRGGASAVFFSLLSFGWLVECGVSKILRQSRLPFSANKRTQKPKRMQ